MTILKRFKDIMTSNINALLDKAEDPEKMIDQVLRDLDRDLRNVKSETAGLMAEEKRAKRDLDDLVEEAKKMETYAMKALKDGNEDDAKKFIERKQELLEREEALKKNYELAVENSIKMREMHDKLNKDIDELNRRKQTIKSKMAVAKTQEKINQVGSSGKNIGDSISLFERMEDKANRALDEAEAMSELNKSINDDVEDLISKYDDGNDSSVEDELQRLKDKLNED